jgi:hypothetical protein
MDQLDRVSLRDLDVLELVTAENLAIEFDHDKQGVEIEGFHEVMDRKPRLDFPLLPVHLYLNAS